MPEWKNSVYDGHLNLIASDMSLHDALLFCKAFYEDAYAEPKVALLIQRMDPEKATEAMK